MQIDDHADDSDANAAENKVDIINNVVDVVNVYVDDNVVDVVHVYVDDNVDSKTWIRSWWSDAANNWANFMDGDSDRNFLFQ